MKTINLFPLAGEGKRFKDEDYKTPKPLIKISGLPMIVQAARALPSSDQHIFVCRKEHLDNHDLGNILKKYFNKTKIIPVDYLTEGQASTCLLAEDYLDPDSPLNIGACDNSMVYEMSKYDEFCQDPNVDALIWTFRNNPTAWLNPEMYGWVRIDRDNYATQVSVKVPISNNPKRDHAIIGTFSFKKAKYFTENAHKMKKADRRINNEFYVDECMNFLIENGLKVKVLEVNHYICWGTPDDLRTFEYWQNFFDLSSHHPYTKRKDPDYVGD